MGALQVGRRSMIVCGALVVAPTSTVFTPQELAHQLVALDYGNGTAYAGLQMLEGAMPREAVTTCAAATSPAERFAASDARRVRGHRAAGAVDHRAEKAGCRLVSTTFFHGTWVADPRRRARRLRRLPARHHAGGPPHQRRQAPVRVLLHARLARPPRGGRARAPTTSTWAASSSRSRRPFPSARRAGPGSGWPAGA